MLFPGMTTRVDFAMCNYFRVEMDALDLLVVGSSYWFYFLLLNWASMLVDPDINGFDLLGTYYCTWPQDLSFIFIYRLK